MKEKFLNQNPRKSEDSEKQEQHLKQLLLKGCLLFSWKCYRPGFLAFPNQQKLIGNQRRNSGKPLLGLLLQQEGVKTSNRSPCLLPEWGGAGSLYGVRVGAGPGIRLEGWFAHPFGRGMCRGHVQYPAFAPGTLFLLLALQKWQLGFCLFVSCCP